MNIRINEVLSSSQYQEACRFCAHVRGKLDTPDGITTLMTAAEIDIMDAIPVCYLASLVPYTDSYDFAKYIAKNPQAPDNCPKENSFDKTGYDIR